MNPGVVSYLVTYPVENSVSVFHPIGQPCISTFENFPQQVESGEQPSLYLTEIPCQQNFQPYISTLENFPSSTEDSSIQLSLTSGEPVEQSNIITLENISEDTMHGENTLMHLESCQSINQPSVINFQEFSQGIDPNQHSSIVQNIDPNQNCTILQNIDPNQHSSIVQDIDSNQHSSILYQPINQSTVINLQNLSQNSELSDNNLTSANFQGNIDMDESSISMLEMVPPESNIITFQNFPEVVEPEGNSTVHLTIPNQSNIPSQSNVTYENFPQSTELDQCSTVTPSQFTDQQNFITLESIPTNINVDEPPPVNTATPHPIKPTNFATSEDLPHKYSSVPLTPRYQISCETCGKIFQSRKTLKVHLKKHTLSPCSSEKYVCDICEKAFESQHVLKEHQERHLETIVVQPEQCSCKLCNKTFSSKYLLNKHEGIHFLRKPYICHVCDKGFVRKQLAEKHMRIHTVHSCTKCGKTLSNTDYLSAHKCTDSDSESEETSDSSEEIPYSCSICDKTFIQIADLVNHKRGHEADKLYSCDLCENAFSAMHLLKIHMQNRHSASLDCTKCGKKYSTLRRLENHYRVHSGENTFICHICEKTFTSDSALQVHMRRHSTEKQFVCETCGKGFRVKHYLEKHVLLHTNQKSFTCDICYKEFVSEWHVSVHKRYHRRKRRKKKS